MRRLILILWLTLTLHHALAAPTTLRIVSWNLQWFPGGSLSASVDDQTRHIRAVQQQLRELQPDVLILQEIRSLPLLEQTLKPLDPSWNIAIVSRFKQGYSISGQQIAIAAKVPAIAAWAEPWSQNTTSPPRGYAYALYQFKGKKIAFYGLHLKSNLGDPSQNTAQREDAIRQLLQHLQAPPKNVIPPDSVVIAGDFNTDYLPHSLSIPASTNEQTFSLLRQHGFDWAYEGIHHQHRITCPSKGRFPPACFDHFFTKNLGAPLAQPKPSTASDHLPVVMDLILP